MINAIGLKGCITSLGTIIEFTEVMIFENCNIEISHFSTGNIRFQEFVCGN